MQLVNMFRLLIKINICRSHDKQACEQINYVQRKIQDSEINLGSPEKLYAFLHSPFIACRNVYSTPVKASIQFTITKAIHPRKQMNVVV